MCCSPVSHLLCSPHQEWNGLWWISTKRSETHKEQQFSQVCYLKPGNLGIQLTGMGGTWGCWLESDLYIEMFQGYLINDWPHSETGVIAPPFFYSGSFSFCWVFASVTHPITAPSFLISNPVGRTCQTSIRWKTGWLWNAANNPRIQLPPLSYTHALSLSCLLLPFTLVIRWLEKTRERGGKRTNQSGGAQAGGGTPLKG